MKFKNLSILTITYNNENELIDTIESINPLLKNGAKSIIINGGNILKSDFPYSKIITEKDNGIYDALNKGLDLIKTDYLMFIHSGDELFSLENVQNLFYEINENGFDICLGATIIKDDNYQRKHSSFFWKPWMLLFYAQPPHLSAIYSTNLFKHFRFNKKLSIVSDFYMFKFFFKKKLNYSTSSNLIVKQLPNGKSSNMLNVTKEFFFFERSFKPILFLPIRLILKLLMSYK